MKPTISTLPPPPEAPKKYTEAWYKLMTKIWQDRIDLMDAVDTGALRRSVQGSGFRAAGYDMSMTFKFMQYGLYVDAGTGRGYTRGNGGDLDKLGKAYRKLHGLGKTRERRPWFSRSWNISREVLKNKLAQLMGQAFKGTFSDL